LQEQGSIHKAVLGAGFGAGGKALYLSTCGHRLGAVDGAPAANVADFI
jgi:hypothetical protein